MHMADALLSPIVGGAMWTVSAAAMAVASRGVRERGDDRLVPLMGVLGAFVFAAQMINFAIPATGSSGHLGGGLLLAALLGPHAAFIVIASVLTVQALFFADGGLLALGANMFNMGVLPCFLAYPLICRPLSGAPSSRQRVVLASIVAAIVALQLGAFAVVLETTLSAISSLPTTTFLMLMQPIHLAIGVVEGLATAAILLFLRDARPDLLDRSAAGSPLTRVSIRPLLAVLALAALLTAGVVSRFASTQPDGLEWSLAHLGATEARPALVPTLHTRLAEWQQHLAWLPGYGRPTAAQAAPPSPAWSTVAASPSLAGVGGVVATLALVMAVGLVLRRRLRTRV
jgi:cobalt/nickel transport system permease protein